MLPAPNPNTLPADLGAPRTQSWPDDCDKHYSIIKNSSYFCWGFNFTFSSSVCFGTYGAIRLQNKSFNVIEKAGGYVTEAISHGEHLVLLVIVSFLLYFVTLLLKSLYCAVPLLNSQPTEHFPATGLNNVTAQASH